MPLSPVHESNQRPVHFLHGFVDYLNQQLRLNIQVSAIKGDIHLSPEERTSPCQLEALGWNAPFWIIVAGGKFDYTVKWWDFARWQAVVDHFRGRIQFVQVGGNQHFHPKLEGAVDLRGRTTLRELVRLMYHAQGIVCPVTCAMHLAAAVPTKDGKSLRPCVVVAGGREPAHWEAYPGHQFIHTIGALPCCQTGGCWKARTLALGDGDPNDSPYRRCLRVKGTMPECMDMITAEEVIRRIEMYFDGGACRYLSGERAFIPVASDRSNPNKPMDPQPPSPIETVLPENENLLTEENARVRSEKFIETIQAYPGGHSGRGIVICGGGFKYFPCAWVCINMLRRLGCKLPIQLWHFGPKECDAQTRSLVEPLGVECVDALEVRERNPANITRGWPLKPYAIIHSSFKEVLFLDADNVPVVDPEFLFDTPQFKNTGAIFWPDYKRLAAERVIWILCGVGYRDEPEFESGQIVVDKQRCWKSLQLTMWYNEHANFFYEHIHGDKDTFHMAWRKLGQEYSMPAKGIHRLPWVMCQHDFEGRRIFQHRNMAKWTLYGKSFSIFDFKYEKECKDYLNQLRELWKPEMNFDLAKKSAGEKAAADEIIPTRFDYHRIGYDQRPMTFNANGMVGEGAAGCEIFWNVRQNNGHVVLEISSEKELTCRLLQDADGVWRGHWEIAEGMPIELRPTEVDKPVTVSDGLNGMKPWWSPVKFVPPDRAIKILQVVPSHGLACGVSNFAANFARFLQTQNCTVETTRAFYASDADLILVQHEFGLFQTELLKQCLYETRQKKILFAHSPVAGVFENYADGFVAMCPRMVASKRPICVFPHPGFVPGHSPEKAELKDKFGFSGYNAVLGTSGFISPARQFDRIAEKLLPHAVQNNWLIQIIASKHYVHDERPDFVRQERRLLELQQRHPQNLRVVLGFVAPQELHERLRACDLVWCWTDTASKAYSSGSCSDQYASGSTLIVASKQQHSAVFGLPNVIVAEANLDRFLARIVATAKERKFSEHDGRLVSWEQCAKGAAKFLHEIVAKTPMEVAA